MFAAKVEHLLSLGDTSNVRARETMDIVIKEVKKGERTPDR
ncbi:MAG: hypothetical protein WA461_00780 [Nitrososphaeraceae archaeon]